MSQYKRSVLVDGMHLCYRHFHVMKDKEDSYKDDKFIGFYNSIMNSIRYIRRRYRGYTIYVLWDSNTSKRTAMYPDYKKRPKKKAEKEERVKIYSLLPDLKILFRSHGIHQITGIGYEADDVAGYMVDFLVDKVPEIILWTGDLDWAQLIRPKVKWMKLTSTVHTVFDARSFKTKYGYPPSGVTIFKALTGDRSDNIKGLYLFPKKLAAELACHATSIESFYYDRAILNNVPDKWKELIKTQAVELRRNYNLVTLMKVDRIHVDKAVENKEVFDAIVDKYCLDSFVPKTKRDIIYDKMKKKVQERQDSEEIEKEKSSETLIQW